MRFFTFFIIMLFCLGAAFNLFAQNTRSEEDTIPTFIRTWQLEEDFISPHFIKPDTFINQFQVYNPVYQQAYSNSYLGNIGLPSKSNFLFPDDGRISNSTLISPLDAVVAENDLIFSGYYKLYMITPDNQRWYHTNKPYTHLLYTTGTKGQREQTIKALHTQNIKPKLNIGVFFYGLKADGEYSDQLTQNSSVNLFTHYNSLRYQMYASFQYNKNTIDHSGGYQINYDSIPTDQDIRSFLSNASTTNGKNSLSLINTYILGDKIYKKNDTLVLDTVSSFLLNPLKNNIDKDTLKNDSTLKIKFVPKSAFSHILRYDRNYYVYQDDDPSGDYYRNVYFDSLNTYDSVYHHVMRNSLQYRIGDFANRHFQSYAFLRYNLYHHKIYNFQNYLFDVNDTTFVNHSLTAASKGELSDNKSGYEFFAEYYHRGYKQGQFSIAGKLNSQIKLFSDTAQYEINLKIASKKPDFFESRYFSNHFKWQNDFEPRQSAKMNFLLNLPGWNLSMRLNAGVLNNHIYYDSLSVPVQHKKYVGVLSSSLDHRFQFGILNNYLRATYQYVSDKEIIRLPEISVFNSIYIEAFLFNVLTLQFGFDIFYNTPFETCLFNPAISQYYLQYGTKTGGKPITDVFLNLKLKTAIIFFKYEHLNSLLEEEIYLPMANYPMDEAAYKFGISWRFHD